MTSLISFIIILQFSEYRSFASLGRFISRYFILFDVMVNGIVSLISPSDTSFLVYKNATYFCIILLYPATLLNSLMTSHSFLVESLGFSMYSIKLSANSDSFTSAIPIWIPFISFSSLIAVGGTSKTMLNKSCKSRHPCLVSDCRGKDFRPIQRNYVLQKYLLPM